MGRRRKNAPVLSDDENPAVRNGANERERDRMRVLSKAFSKLKTTLPWVPPDTKLSKLDTLRLATCYIAHLRQILSEDEGDEIHTRILDIKPLPTLNSDRCQGNNRLVTNGNCDNMMPSTNRPNDTRVLSTDGSYIHPMNLTWPFSFNGRYNVSPSDLNRLSASQQPRSEIQTHEESHTTSHMSIS